MQSCDMPFRPRSIEYNTLCRCGGDTIRMSRRLALHELLRNLLGSNDITLHLFSFDTYALLLTSRRLPCRLRGPPLSYSCIPTLSVATPDSQPNASKQARTKGSILCQDPPSTLPSPLHASKLSLITSDCNGDKRLQHQWLFSPRHLHSPCSLSAGSDCAHPHVLNSLRSPQLRLTLFC